jgi:hypothetical protein
VYGIVYPITFNDNGPVESYRVPVYEFLSPLSSLFCSSLTNFLAMLSADQQIVIRFRLTAAFSPLDTWCYWFYKKILHFRIPLWRSEAVNHLFWRAEQRGNTQHPTMTEEVNPKAYPLAEQVNWRFFTLLQCLTFFLIRNIMLVLRRIRICDLINRDRLCQQATGL